MSTEENKAIVRRFVQVWGKGSLDTVDELAAPDFSVYYPLLRETVHGPEAFKQVLMGVHAGLPDVEAVSEDVIAEGEISAQSSVAECHSCAVHFPKAFVRTSAPPAAATWVRNRST